MRNAVGGACCAETSTEAANSSDADGHDSGDEGRLTEDVDGDTAAGAASMPRRGVGEGNDACVEVDSDVRVSASCTDPGGLGDGTGMANIDGHDRGGCMPGHHERNCDPFIDTDRESAGGGGAAMAVG